MVASFIGTAIEWYDFFLYGTAAALVFSRLFFPNVDPLVGTLSSFGTFAVGFVARPLGGVVFGHFGDRVGRKAMLIYSLLIMGVATFLIGLLPTFDSIGVWAPVLLVVLRCLQGIGVGGEWGGAVLMAVEHSPEGGADCPAPGRRWACRPDCSCRPWCSASSATARRSSIPALGLAAAVSPQPALVGVGLFVRLRFLETPAFARLQASGAGVAAARRPRSATTAAT